MPEVEVSQDEIDEVLEKCDEQEAKGESRWPGMTYEEGVSSALRWMLGLTDDNPMDD